MFLSSMFCAFLAVAPSPESEGVSSRKVVEWLDACDREIDSLVQKVPGIMV